jgi:hypothetical protein
LHLLQVSIYSLVHALELRGLLVSVWQEPETSLHCGPAVPVWDQRI